MSVFATVPIGRWSTYCYEIGWKEDQCDDCDDSHRGAIIQCVFGQIKHAVIYLNRSHLVFEG